MSRFLNRSAVILAAIVAMFIIFIAVYLVWMSLSYATSPPTLFSGLFSTFLLFGIINILIASAVEIALFWLLVVLDIISRRHGLIATLVIVVLVGTTILISNIISVL